MIPCSPIQKWGKSPSQRMEWRDGLRPVPGRHSGLASKFALTLLLSATLTLADTHYVDVKNDAPEPPYTSRHTAANSIEMALEAATANDTVLVARGTYIIERTLHISKPLTLRSMDGAAVTVVDAKRRCTVIEIDASPGPIELDGFTVTGGYLDSGAGGGITVEVESHKVSIMNCIITRNEAQHGGGVSLTGMKGHYESVVQNCLISKNKAGWGGAGIKTYVRGNAPRSITLRNCTIVDNQGQFFGVINGSAENPRRSVKIVDSIIAWNSGGGAFRFDLSRCILYRNGDSDTEECDGDFHRTNPCFIDRHNGNYRLRPGSPCIDRGSKLRVEASVDLDGLPRIMDGNLDGNAVVDLGAYEVQVVQVEIDIKPGYRNNAINLKAGGLLPVAILTTDTFDASTVNPATVRFANAPPVRRMFCDVDADGDADLLMEFTRKKLELDDDSRSGSLTGETNHRQLFMAEDRITVVNE